MTVDECKEHFAQDAVYTNTSGAKENVVIGLVLGGLVRIHLWKNAKQLTVNPIRLELKEHHGPRY